MMRKKTTTLWYKTTGRTAEHNSLSTTWTKKQMYKVNDNCIFCVFQLFHIESLYWEPQLCEIILQSCLSTVSSRRSIRHTHFVFQYYNYTICRTYQRTSQLFISSLWIIHNTNLFSTGQHNRKREEVCSITLLHSVHHVIDMHGMKKGIPPLVLQNIKALIISINWFYEGK
jgi:hypothetical protein